MFRSSVPIMADPLSLLRQYNINKKEIVEKNNQIIFGELSWCKNVHTNFLMYGTGKNGSQKEYYTLECLLFFLKNLALSHPVYVRQAAAENIPIVHRPDRRDLIAYLNGETATCRSIDKSARLEMPTQVKRSGTDDSLESVAKKPRLEDTLQVHRVEKHPAARLDAPEETAINIKSMKFVEEKSFSIAMASESGVVQCKDFIILKRGTHLILHQLTKKLGINFLGSNIDLSNIVGTSYSSIFHLEMARKNCYTLERCSPHEIPTGLATCSTECGIDNRNIQDDNNAQALSKEEIIDMKNAGLSSQDIVMQLINNSKTFSHKTEFAQEKWLQKKSKKYSDYLQVLKPNIRLLSEVLMCSTASPNNFKLLGLRMDTLSQIITFANFQPQGKFIVYENGCEGLITASLLNLLDCQGKLLNVITPNYSFNKRKALLAMKFSEEKHKSVINISLSTFAKYAKRGNNSFDSTFSSSSALLEKVDETKATSSSSSFVVNEDRLEKINTSSCHDDSGDMSQTAYTFPIEHPNPKRKAESGESECKRTNYQERGSEEVRQLLDKKADGLIVVCKEKPNEFVKDMLQFIAPSRSFVVFSQFHAPLVQLYQDLKLRHDVINIRVVENWLRSYQVLTDRTHPEINMLGNGGYLLTGIVVTN